MVVVVVVRGGEACVCNVVLMHSMQSKYNESKLYEPWVVPLDGKGEGCFVCNAQRALSYNEG